MAVARIGEVQAKLELIKELQDFLVSIMPEIKDAEGCESVQLYQSEEDPSKFMMVEVWDSVESHQASVKSIPPEKLGEIRPLLATSPSGRYFRLIE
jgi:quinol monooxygenase YgiN